MKNLFYLIIVGFMVLFASCASSKGVTTIAKGNDMSNYKYVVFGNEEKGDAELTDLILMVENDISEKFQVVSLDKARTLIMNGENVLYPKINVKTEKWYGGHTYITISFSDYNTNKTIAVVKSSGIGYSISHDQKLAYKAIKKQLNKAFK